MGPGLRVVSREISESFAGGFVAEASQSGSIVIADEGEDVSVACVSIGEAFVVARGVVGNAAEVLGDPSVEALDHAVGLRAEGSCELVDDGAAGAEAIDGMGA